MVNFQYKITDEIGLHARPAGLLAKKAKEYDAKIILEYKDKSTDATRLMQVMALGIQCGDEITVSVEGNEEEKAAIEMEQFFKDNL